MSVFTASEALEMALEIEKSGEVFYNEAAAQSDDPELKELFVSLAAQERGHYRAFQKMLEGVAPGPPLDDADFAGYAEYVQTALEQALFAGPDKALSLAKQAADRESALRAALGFEKDTLLFFYDLRDIVSEPDREVVTHIIREEKRHLRSLARLLRG